ncbi:hypothetical protein ASPBRDRAFT_560880 [Aspergillus brasiliensis CBS 101740]|uniref:Uncharacterized protein n=1 Tax=Aspergillus brasiliensis (strain CBS 101740 / IMI 381727 / IBT 21946) TaxID=767769 RepID=A0A1L9UMS3_ASPBC|nr:hypothetical protein ASPBRDRAFT_560880 [Aspergillus brasiliensis CBS 101740]
MAVSYQCAHDHSIKPKSGKRLGCCKFYSPSLSSYHGPDHGRVTMSSTETITPNQSSFAIACATAMIGIDTTTNRNLDTKCTSILISLALLRSILDVEIRISKRSVQWCWVSSPVDQIRYPFCLFPSCVLEIHQKTSLLCSNNHTSTCRGEPGTQANIYAC